MTYNEVLTLLPFRNPMSKILIKGSTLKKALEHSVAKYQSKYDKEVPNEFLQVSGKQNFSNIYNYHYLILILACFRYTRHLQYV